MDTGILTRRRMLGLLAATGASLLASSSKASAFFDFFSAFAPADPKSLSAWDIPDEWRVQLGSTLGSYANYLGTLRLKNLPVRQLVGSHAKSHGSVKNTLPPKAFWKNIRETLRVVDGLSRRLEMKPSVIVSMYRSPAYNARCHGAKSHSYHLRNNAMDITFPCSPGKVTAMARAMRSAGIFKGGVGGYRGFTHIDTRGFNADWGRGRS